MTQEERKNRELSLLKPLFSEFNIPTPENPQQESPDFVVDFQGRRIGIEVTRCCPSKKYCKAQRKPFSVLAACRSRIQLAKAEYMRRMRSRKDNRAIMLSLCEKSFWDVKCSTQSFIDSFCAELDELLLNYRPQPLKSEKEIIEDLANHSICTKDEPNTYIKSIGLVLENSEPFVGSFDSQLIQHVTQDDLDSEFEAKNIKLRDYKARNNNNKAIHEYWLVIGIQNDECYEFYEFPEFYNKNKCLFDRVFIVHYGKMHEIK